MRFGPYEVEVRPADGPWARWEGRVARANAAMERSVVAIR